jgi:hypothetical protein
VNILIYVLAGIAALEIAGLVVLLGLWTLTKIVARAQIRRLQRRAAMAG